MSDSVKELTERMEALAENVGHALGVMSKQVEDLTQRVELLSETEDLQPTCNQLATDNINRQAAIEWCLEGLNNMPPAEPKTGE